MENEHRPSETVMDQVVLPGGVSICIDEQRGMNGTKHNTIIYPGVEMVELLIGAKQAIVSGISAIIHGAIAIFGNNLTDSDLTHIDIEAKQPRANSLQTLKEY